MVGQKIKALREARALSQEDLAKLVGVNHATIYRIENGKSKPHGITLRAIAKALKVNVEELAE